MCLAAWIKDHEARSHNLATNVSVDTNVKHDLWHRKLGHSSMIFFRGILPLTTCHNQIISDALKLMIVSHVFKTNLLKYSFILNYPNISIIFMVIFMVPLIPPPIFFVTILSWLTPQGVIFKFFYFSLGMWFFLNSLLLCYNIVTIFQIIILNIYIWIMPKNLDLIFLRLLYYHMNFFDIFCPL